MHYLNCSPSAVSSICPSVVYLSDFSPRASARLSKLLNPCSMVAQYKSFLTLVSRFFPFACWPPFQPSYALHPHHGQPILRSHDRRGFLTLVPAFVPSLFSSAPHFPTTSSHITACHYQCFSVARHMRFPTSVPAFIPLHLGSLTTIQLLHTRSAQAFILPGPSSAGSRTRMLRQVRLHPPTLSLPYPPPMSLSLACGTSVGSNSLGFPKPGPAGQCP